MNVMDPFPQDKTITFVPQCLLKQISEIHFSNVLTSHQYHALKRTYSASTAWTRTNVSMYTKYWTDTGSVLTLYPDSDAKCHVILPGSSVETIEPNILVLTENTPIQIPTQQFPNLLHYVTETIRELVFEAGSAGIRMIESKDQDGKGSFRITVYPIAIRGRSNRYTVDACLCLVRDMNKLLARMAKK